MMTEQFNFKRLVPVLGAVFLGAMVAGHGTTAAQSEAQAEQADSQATESGQPNEGIKVHGHWVIEVRDPDGTLVNRREFDNALALNGGSTLANVLGRNIAIGIWRVTLTGSSGNQPCTNQINPQTSCHIDESTSTDSLNNVFKNLVVTSSPIGPNGSLTLSGNAVAQLDGEVDLVNTEFGECPGTTAPSDCIIRNGRRFTSAQIPAVPVQVGQQIQVTVTISFS